MKNDIPKFNSSKYQYFSSKSPVLKNIFSVDFRFVDQDSLAKNYSNFNLKTINPGPLTVYTFLDEKNLLLRFEFLCLIIDKFSFKNYHLFQFFNDTEFIATTETDVDLMKELNSTLKIKFSKEHEDYINNFRKYFEKTDNNIVKITWKPLCLYSILRFDYPKRKFQDKSFFYFGEEITQKSPFFNLSKRSGRELKEYKPDDFITIKEVSNTNIYKKAVYIPTFQVFIIKHFKERNRIEREIEFHKYYDFFSFVKCIGYLSRDKDKELLFPYMPNMDFVEYCKTATEGNRLINFLRILYAIFYLHRNSIVYRNLKYSKILIDNDNMAYLSNFSYFWKTSEKLNELDIGSEKFAPKEQLEGIFETKNDVYSLGMIFSILFFKEENKTRKLGQLNTIITEMKLKDYTDRLSIEEIIPKINEIIETYPTDRVTKKNVHKYHNFIIKKFPFYVNWNLKFIKLHDAFLDNLFNVKLYKVKSTKEHKFILDCFFNNSFTPFIVIDIQIIENENYLIIAFESSCLIINLKILDENNFYYKNLIFNQFKTNVDIYLASKEKKSFFSDKYKIIENDIFIELIENASKFHEAAKSKIKDKKNPDEFALKSFHVLIGYSIKRFYYKKEQFNDPYFFNFQQTQEDNFQSIKEENFQQTQEDNFQPIKEKKKKEENFQQIQNENFIPLKSLNKTRYIFYNFKTIQLFMGISSDKDYIIKEKLNTKKIHHQTLCDYYGFLKSGNRFIHLFEIVNDLSLNEYLNDPNNEIIKNYPLLTKFFIEILHGYDYCNDLISDENIVSHIFINTNYIFIDNYQNIKICFPEFFQNETIYNNLLNLDLLLLSFNNFNKHCGDLTFHDINSNSDLQYLEKTIKQFQVKSDNYPLSFICYICDQKIINFCNIIDYDKRKIILNFLKLIYFQKNLFLSDNTEKNLILEEYNKIGNRIDYDKEKIEISIKLDSETFFKNSSLPQVIKNFKIYYFNSCKEFFYNEILIEKLPPLATFFLDKIEGTMNFIFVFNNIVIIYNMKGLEIFLNSFFSNWKSKKKINLIPLNQESRNNLQELFHIEITNQENLSLSYLNKIASQYCFKNQSSKEFISFELITLYLIKSYGYKQEEFSDSSFFTSTFSQFTEFNLNDFFYLDFIGSGGTSFIQLGLYKNTFRLYAIKQYKREFIVCFEREKDFYNKIFCYISPFIVKCYGFIRNSTSLVIEYMPNGNLEEFRKKEEIDKTFLTNVLLNILSGLEFIHSQNFFYRDLKPDNIILDQNYTPLLIDFGSVLPGNQKTSDITFVFGNLLFASPEFRNGDKYSFKTDVYSFGILINYLCCDKKILMNDMKYIQTQKLLPPQFNCLQDIFTSCIQSDPSYRMETKDLLFDIIYNDIFIPGIDKTQINQLINKIIYHNFKNTIYLPFFYMKGIKQIYDLVLPTDFSIEDIENNKCLSFEFGNLYLKNNDLERAFHYFKKSHSLENSKGTVMLGNFYFEGKHVKKDYNKALSLYESVKNINSDAMNNYGYLLSLGSTNSTKNVIDKSIKIFNKAIKIFNKKESFINLGDIYSKTSPQNSINYYFSATKFNYDIAYIKLALLCIKLNRNINENSAEYYFQKALEINKSLSTYRLMYNLNYNAKISLNDKERIDCLSSMQCFNQLGKLYLELAEKRKLQKNSFEKTNTENEKQNIDYFELAKKSFLEELKLTNDSQSQNYLGFLFYNEEIKSKGFIYHGSKALKYFKKASKSNIASQYNLGLIYYQYGSKDVRSLLKSIIFFKKSSEKGHIKSIVKLGRIYEDHFEYKESIKYYEEALNKSKLISRNKIGLLYFISGNIKKSSSYFQHAHNEGIISGSYSYAVYLLYLEKDLENSYGIFFYLHRDYKFILASCNLGFYYERKHRIDDSIPYFEEALKNFNENHICIEKNDLLIDEISKECIYIIIFLTYLMTLKYYLSNFNTFINSIELFQYHSRKLMNFYSSKIEVANFIRNLNASNNVEFNLQINNLFDDINKNPRYYIHLQLLDKILTKEIIIIKNEIEKNNFSILFGIKPKINSNLRNFYSGFFDTQIDLTKSQSVFSSQNIIFNFQFPIHLTFKDMYPNETCLIEFFDNFKLDFIFVSFFNDEFKDQLNKMANDTKFMFYNIISKENKDFLMILFKNYFVCFQSKSTETNFLYEILTIFHNSSNFDTESAKKLISDEEFSNYFDYLKSFIFQEDELLEGEFITSISYFFLLFQFFNEPLGMNGTNSKLPKFDILDIITLKQIQKCKSKVIHIYTNSVYQLKAIESKEEQKNEIEFYSFFKELQEKHIIPKLLGKIENEGSLLFEYFENFEAFYENKWYLIDPTKKTIILIKMLILIYQLHSYDIILCGIQLDTFLITVENQSFNLLIDDLYHFHCPDYSVSSKSEFVAPEIKQSLEATFYSDIFSFGKIAIKLGMDKDTEIIAKCISENVNERPDSYCLLKSIYRKKTYMPGANKDVVDKFVEEFISSIEFQADQ